MRCHGVHVRPSVRVRAGFLAWIPVGLALLALLAAGRGQAASMPPAFPPQVQRPLEREDWPALLRALEGDPLTNATLRLVTARALFEIGRLPEELFARIHEPGPELLSTSGLHAYEGAAHLAEALLHIGYLNGAERLAFDSLEMEGENPSALRTLVRLHVIRGLTNAARVFLNRLEAYPEHRSWVAGFRTALGTTRPDDAEPSLSRIRANLFTRDRIVSGLTTERVLKQALETNPTNRMAFEFLVAHQLLGRELLPVRGTLASSPLLREGPLPRHYAEAVLLHRSLYPGIGLATLLPRVPPEVGTNFVRFQELMKSAPGSPEKLQPSAWRDFGTTYWYYYFFGPRQSPDPAPDSRTR